MWHWILITLEIAACVLLTKSFLKDVQQTADRYHAEAKENGRGGSNTSAVQDDDNGTN